MERTPGLEVTPPEDAPSTPKNTGTIQPPSPTNTYWSFKKPQEKAGKWPTTPTGDASSIDLTSSRSSVARSSVDLSNVDLSSRNSIDLTATSTRSSLDLLLSKLPQDRNAKFASDYNATTATVTTTATTPTKAPHRVTWQTEDGSAEYVKLQEIPPTKPETPRNFQIGTENPIYRHLQQDIPLPNMSILFFFL